MSNKIHTKFIEKVMLKLSCACLMLFISILLLHVQIVQYINLLPLLNPPQHQQNNRKFHQVLPKLHSVHWGITPSLFFAKPPLNLQTVQAPLFRQFPSIYCFFVNPLPT